jgi:hypothetical protein
VPDVGQAVGCTVPVAQMMQLGGVPFPDTRTDPFPSWSVAFVGVMEVANSPPGTDSRAVAPAISNHAGDFLFESLVMNLFFSPPSRFRDRLWSESAAKRKPEYFEIPKRRITSHRISPVNVRVYTI